MRPTPKRSPKHRRFEQALWVRNRMRPAAVVVAGLLSMSPMASGGAAVHAQTVQPEAPIALTSTVRARRAPIRDAVVQTVAPSVTLMPPAAVDQFGRAVAEKFVPPSWLGHLPIGERDPASQLHVPRPELAEREFATMTAPLPPPPAEAYHFTNEPLSDEVVARSTWHEGCPVAREDLRHLTVSHWGFEGNVHTGELIVHARYATGIVDVFRTAFEVEYPIEQLRIVAPSDISTEVAASRAAGEPVGGDGNGSGAYACRSTVSSSRWSEHASGLAIDLNPFHNPYIKVSANRSPRLVPAMSQHYLDRSWVRRGMLTADHPVVQAFADIGWEWGGDWESAKDWMHFSHNGW